MNFQSILLTLADSEAVCRLCEDKFISKEKKNASTFHPLTLSFVSVKSLHTVSQFHLRIIVKLNGNCVGVCWREVKARLRNKCIIISNLRNQFISCYLILIFEDKPVKIKTI